MLFDGDGNRMTPSHAIKKGTRYRYYVSGSLITKDRTETSAGLRIPAFEIEHLVSSRLHGWLLDPGSIYKSTWGRLTDASTQQRLVARAADIGRMARAASATQARRPHCPDRTDRGEVRPDRHPSPPASALRATRSTRFTIARRERRRNRAPVRTGAAAPRRARDPCRRPIKMSPLCQFEMTLPADFPGGVWGDGSTDERWGVVAARGAAGFGSAALDGDGRGTAAGARAPTGISAVEGVSH